MRGSGKGNRATDTRKQTWLALLAMAASALVWMATGGATPVHARQVALVPPVAASTTCPPPDNPAPDAQALAVECSPPPPPPPAEAAFQVKQATVHASEGKEFKNQVLATFTDTDAPSNAKASEFPATVEWGDNTSSNCSDIKAACSVSVEFKSKKLEGTVRGSHAYAETGTFPIAVTITDKHDVEGDQDTADSSAVVADSALTDVTPTGSLQGTEGSPFEGVVASFTDANPNAPDVDFSATINWDFVLLTIPQRDDASISKKPPPVTIHKNANGVFEVRSSHTYDEEGTFNVLVSIADKDGATLEVTRSIEVTDAALAAKAGADLKGIENQPLEKQLLATFTDANPASDQEDLSATIEWGDGKKTTVAGKELKHEEADGFDVIASHTYLEGGTYSVSVTVKDKVSIAAPVTLKAEIEDLPLKAASTKVEKGTEGSSTGDVVIAEFQDKNLEAEPGEFKASIDWGDGEKSDGKVRRVTDARGVFSVTADHTFAEEGVHKVKVSISDKGGSKAEAESEVTVGDAALTTFSGGQIRANQDEDTGAVVVATFKDANPKPDITDFSAKIDWGDKSDPTDGAIGEPKDGRFPVNGSHVYAKTGQFTITITVTDKGGSKKTTESKALVGPPVLEATSRAVEGIEGASTGDVMVATFTDRNSDAKADDLHASIDWGDGSKSDGTVTQRSEEEDFQVTGSHTFAEEGTYKVKVTIGDKAGHSAGAEGKATLTDAALAATGTTLSAFQNVDTGSVVVASFKDANPSPDAKDFSATIDWGDGSSGSSGAISAGGGKFNVKGSHTYGKTGSFIITVTASDAGGSSGTAKTAATVTLAPLAASGKTATGTEGVSIGDVVIATFTDPDKTTTSDAFRATIDWGDGNGKFDGKVAGSHGEFTVTGSHKYAEEGTYTVKVAISDTAERSASAQSTVKVADAALTAAAGPAISVTQGQNTGNVVVATFTDANPTTDLSELGASIDWGDGSTPTLGTVSEGSGGFAVKGNHTYSSHGSFTIKVTILDLGGSTSTATTTATVAAPPPVAALAVTGAGQQPPSFRLVFGAALLLAGLLLIFAFWIRFVGGYKYSWRSDG